MIRATPFHSRAAEFNRANAWSARGGFTVSQFYSDVAEEALAARASAVMCDISFRKRLRISGSQASDFLSCLATQDITRLEIGAAVAALWLNDNGVEMGQGVVARLGRESFVVETASTVDWIEKVAVPFRLSIAREDAGLALIGPSAPGICAAVGMPVTGPMSVQIANWHGLEISLSHFALGIEIWCKRDDAEILWDSLMRAGAKFGLIPAGLAALDIIELENAQQPERLVEDTHTGFNGRAAYLDARDKHIRSVVGLDIDCETPAPHAQLLQKSLPVGRVLSSLYSPALGRAIALAELDNTQAMPGTEFSLTFPSDAVNPLPRNVAARAVALPFLPL